MNENTLFSIVIPVYNAEKTIKRTLQSVLAQTFRNYEVVVINDGSKDNSLAILNEFSQHEHIKVITQENAGVSMARNAGIRQAVGEYVIFLDSDDWIEDNFLALFHESLSAHDNRSVDLIVGNLEDERVGRISQYGFFDSDDIPYILGELELSDNIGYLHNKCYKKQVIDEYQLYFMEGISMSEDLLFNLKYFYHINNTLVINSASYHYEDVADSLSKKRVVYNELINRKRYLVELYNTILNKYKQSDLDHFIQGFSKRVLALDMQIVTSMYYSSFSSGEIHRGIEGFKKEKHSKGIFNLLNRNEKLKYMIMNLNTMMAYYFLYVLYRMRAF